MTLSWPGRITVAIVHGDPPEYFVGESDLVLTRVVALHVVAATRPNEIPEPSLTKIRHALLNEDWPTAVAEWIDVTGRPIDMFPDEEIWTDAALDEERTPLEMRVARIFDDPEATP